ncbi:tyrosine-type recombinase/integrase [Pseudonocardia sp. GCM10023141]|uniref:tyrosine-type recombinase/integrase n=1 Tax=Pseudonocardia sp. GCM10023141 TaxID=3252653 RepID=UPI003620BAC6
MAHRTAAAHAVPQRAATRPAPARRPHRKRTLPHRHLLIGKSALVNTFAAGPRRTGAFYWQQLRAWQRECNITDDAGRPVALTAHQWRHTYATTLINKGVRIEVIKQLLDHASLDMASHYARLLDTTIRAEWEAGHGADQMPAGAGAGDGLADAAWHNRPRTALPNGLCGLPRQQTCDHSNKCLTCPVFITTSADLPAHEEHRRRTLTLITQLDDRGQSRLADQNRAVLDHLQARIAEIHDNATNAGPTEGSDAG